MTTKDILNSYDIELQNAIVTMNNGITFNDKVFLGGLNMESLFNMAYTDPDEIDNEILSRVNYVIEGNDPRLDDMSLGGIDASATIHSDAILFHKMGTGQFLQRVPIGDFKIIATAWRDFLKQTPLIGSI